MKNGDKKKIAVAGGAGFLGTNLCNRLLAEGHELICLDNFSSGNRQNLVSMIDSERFTVYERDVRDKLPFEADEIYNLACCASPQKYQLDPLQTIRTSTEGIANLLNYAVARDIRLFQSSTSEIYGDPSVHPQREDYFGNVNPVGPRACYDEGKRCAETMCMDYHRVRGAKVKIARIFNTYGPYMQPQDGRVVSNFIVQALLNNPITIYGDGSQTRSFCYVDDLISGVRALMDSSEAVTGPINLGNPEELSVLDLAYLIVEMIGSSSKITLNPLPEDDPVRRQPDIALAQQLLGWAPSTPLKEGLTHTIDYFEQLLHTKDYFSALKSRGKYHFATEIGQVG